MPSPLVSAPLHFTPTPPPPWPHRPLAPGDGVHQPFEPEIDWSEFSVAVPEADIPRLHEVRAAGLRGRPGAAG